MAVPAANIAQLRSEFVNWLPTMTEVRYLDKVTAQELWNATYKYFAHFKMIQDHLRDKWTPNGTPQQFDTLIASIPDAIMMTQKALNVTPAEDGFQVQQGDIGTRSKAKVIRIPEITRLTTVSIVVIPPLMFFNSSSHSILQGSRCRRQSAFKMAYVQTTLATAVLVIYASFSMLHPRDRVVSMRGRMCDLWLFRTLCILTL